MGRGESPRDGRAPDATSATASADPGSADADSPPPASLRARLAGLALQPLRP